jgi:predicted metal-dependent hydrolase
LITEKLLNIPGIGKVKLRKSNKARRVNIRIKPFEGVELVIPGNGSESDAIAFLLKKKEWIHRSLDKIAQKENNLTIFNEDTDFRTRSFFLKIEKEKRKDIRIRFGNGVLAVSYPENMKVSDPVIQDAIRYGIEEGLRIEAKAFLPGRLAWLASKYGFSFNKVTIKKLRTRWGSCSGVNNINLNLHLMRLPDELIDYVLLHELCHTVVKNHGKKFWQLLDKVTGNRARKLDKMMDNYQTSIY